MAYKNNDSEWAKFTQQKLYRNSDDFIGNQLKYFLQVI